MKDEKEETERVVFPVRKELKERLLTEINADHSKTFQKIIEPLIEAYVSGPNPNSVPQPESKATDWPTDEKGNPLCIHDNKVIVIEYEDIHLGEQIANCRYRRQLKTNFDPLRNSDDLKICLHVCKLQAQNKDISKLAIERAKINMRTTAKFNYEVDRTKALGNVRNVTNPAPKTNKRSYFDDCPVDNKGIKTHRGDCPNTRPYSNGGGSRGEWQPDRTSWKYG